LCAIQQAIREEILPINRAKDPIESNQCGVGLAVAPSKLTTMQRDLF
jgi:hypothetical protein